MATLAPRDGDLNTLLRAVSINPSISLAAVTLGSYDYLLTVQDEITYIWRKPIRSGSLLFLWIRYYGLFTIWFRFLAVMGNSLPRVGFRLPTADPLVLLPISDILVFGLLYSVQVVLQLRVYVMYQSRKLATFNAALFVAEMLVMLVIWAWRRPFANCSILGKLFPQTACTSDYPVYFIPGVVFDVWIGTLAFAKFIQRARRLSKLPRLEGYDVVEVFFRDSAIYYGLTLFCVVIFNVVGSLGHTQSDAGLLDASFFIAGSRLILHLRAAYHRDPSQRTSDEFPIHTVTRLADESFWGGD